MVLSSTSGVNMSPASSHSMTSAFPTHSAILGHRYYLTFSVDVNLKKNLIIVVGDTPTHASGATSSGGVPIAGFGFNAAYQIFQADSYSPLTNGYIWVNPSPWINIRTQPKFKFLSNGNIFVVWVKNTKPFDANGDEGINISDNDYANVYGKILNITINSTGDGVDIVLVKNDFLISKYSNYTNSNETNINKHNINPTITILQDKIFITWLSYYGSTNPGQFNGNPAPDSGRGNIFTIFLMMVQLLGRLMICIIMVVLVHYTRTPIKGLL